MLIDLVDIKGRGNASKEFVHLLANSDCKLGYFILADTTYVSPGVVSNRLRHQFWWPTSDIARKSDHIFVFTGIGSNSVVTNNGVTSRYYYWNLKEPVWNDSGDTAILFQLQDWQTKQVPSK